MNECFVDGEVITAPISRSTTTDKLKCEFTILCTDEFYDRDGTFRIRKDDITLMAWDMHFKPAMGLKVGDKVVVRGKFRPKHNEIAIQNLFIVKKTKTQKGMFD